MGVTVIEGVELRVCVAVPNAEADGLVVRDPLFEEEGLLVTLIEPLAVTDPE